MGFWFIFRQAEDTADVRNLIDFIAAQDLGYSHYDSWIQRTEAELLEGRKQAVVATSDGRIVGDVVYQRHKSLPGVLEVKNVRVHPGMRMRAFGGFMLKQVEVEARGYEGIMADTRSERTDVVNFLHAGGYLPVVTGPLYDPNKTDITFMKPLGRDATRVLTEGADFIRGRIL